MTAYPTLIHDPRPIKSISYDDADGSCWNVGAFLYGGKRVTRIVAYEEKGVGDFTPWLAVYVAWTECRGDAGNVEVEEIAARVPAWKVSVHYG